MRKEITINRRFWRPASEEVAANYCNDKEISGVVVASPRMMTGRFGEERVVDIQTSPGELVTVKLRGHLGNLWDAAPRESTVPGREVTFVYEGTEQAKTPGGKPRHLFKFYVTLG